MALATIISLVGNVQITLPGHENSPFAWLESLAPPIIVLATAYVIKEQILESIEIRHANEQSFQTALAEWRVLTVTPEYHPLWRQVHANALQDTQRNDYR